MIYSFIIQIITLLYYNKYNIIKFITKRNYITIKNL